MSRSDPPRSSIVARLRQNSSPLRPSPAHARSIRRKLSIRFAKLMRWLHIYLSMFGLAAVLFFSVTGITLNHPDWVFGQVERRREAEGQVDLKWIGRDAAAGDSQPAAESEPTKQVAKLEVVEHLRKTHAIRGALADFRVDDNECMVSFKGPGYSADTFIDRESGHYTLTETRPRLHRRDQRPAQGPRHRAGLVGGHRPLGRVDDGHLADRPGLALLSQAPARSRPGRRPRRHGRPHRDLPALGAVSAHAKSQDQRTQAGHLIQRQDR